MSAGSDFMASLTAAQAVLRAARQASDPGWLQDLRRQAMQRLQDQGLPDTRREQWKYTDLRPLRRLGFNLAEQTTAGIDPARITGLAIPGQSGPRLVFVDGHYQAALSQPESGDDGVIVCALDKALQRYQDALKSLLAMPADNNPDHSFQCLNMALMNTGAYIALADGCELDLPVQLLFVNTTTTQNLLSCPRILIHTGANSRVRVIEHYVALGEPQNLCAALTRIEAGPGSSIEHIKVQQESPRAFHIGRLEVHQARASHLDSHTLCLGARLNRNDIDTRLQAEGASAMLNGLYLGKGRQHVDNHTLIEHASPHTRSEEIFKGVLDGHARAVFNGRVIVQPDAQKIESHQHNRNLLLSQDAEVDSKPELEIYADDVSCSHGATVGQIDAQALFYLRSRGIAEADARAVLTYAFADDIIARIGLRPLREHLETVLNEHLPGQLDLEAIA